MLVFKTLTARVERPLNVLELQLSSTGLSKRSSNLKALTLCSSRINVTTTVSSLKADSSTSSAVGVDLGTTNSTVAKFNTLTGRTEVLKDIHGQGLVSMPSVVNVNSDLPPVCGREALRRGASDAANTFYSVKQFIGRKFDEVDASGAVEGVAYSVKSGPGGAVQLHCPARGEHGTVLPEEVSSLVLRGLWENHLGRVPERAVIAVPPHFSPAQRSATELAASLSGCTKQVCLHEPVAASLAYGLEQEEYARVLVCDLGGGTFDVSLVELGAGSAEVMGVAGDGSLGGDHWDQRLVRYLDSAVMSSSSSSSCLGDAEAHAHLTQLATQAKIALTTDSAAEISLSGLTSLGVTGVGGSSSLVITREEFEAETRDLILRLEGPVRRAAEAAGVQLGGQHTRAEGRWVSQWGHYPLDHIVLVGGATRMPAVQDFIHKLGGMQSLSSEEVDPDTAVALGAALYAGMLDGVVDKEIDVVDGIYVW